MSANRPPLRATMDEGFDHREPRGLTLREIAERCGYSYSYLANIEASRKTPRHFTMDCIMKTLSVDAGYVVREDLELPAS